MNNIAEISRRTFVKALALAGGTIALSGCGGKIAIVKDTELAFSMEHELREVLYYASLAPSGHNTQPWLLAVGKDSIVLHLDSSRALPMVDPELRETCISLGAFIENAVRAFAVYGYDIELEIYDTIDLHALNPAVACIKYMKSNKMGDLDALAVMETRHTDKSKYLDRGVSPESVNRLCKQFPELLHYRKGTREYNHILTDTVHANIAQAASLDKRVELSEWLRFSDDEAREKADGLPAEQLGLSGIIKKLYYLTTDRSSAQSDKFAKQSLELVEEQLANTASFFVITGGGDPAGLVKTGMRFQAFWLAATMEGISIHPMSQILEEMPWAAELKYALSLNEPVQMLVRAGYVKDYGENNKIRRPLADFVYQLK